MAKMKLMSFLTPVVAIVLIVAGGLFIANSAGLLSQAPATPSGPVQQAGPQGQAYCAVDQLNLSIRSSDTDRPGTTLSPTNTIYDSEGRIITSSSAVTSGQTYNVLSQTSGYLADYRSVAVGCTPTPSVQMSQTGFDTAITSTVYNANHITPNTISANLTINNGSLAIAYDDLVQSASYKHLGGIEDKFVVYLNASTASNFNPSQMAITFDNQACPVLGSVASVQQATPSAIQGSVIYAAVCTGDFAPQDGSIHTLSARIAANTGVTLSPGTTVGINYAPVDYYKNTITGAVEKGAVKDDGSAVQTLQTDIVYIN